ncbi:MAG: DUF1893 domain-containing protein [Clostridia bacterium]|nr:DUF1893 domain-containing protein [Clostridia bacterium]
MTNLESVKNRLHETNASLVVGYANGEIKEYYSKRVIDIKNILKEDKNALKDAVIADKVIGKVAGTLLSVAGVKEIYTDVMSKYAIRVLEKTGVRYEFSQKVDYIINETKTGMCPMENKYKDENDLDKIYNEIMAI